jgi:hypothetical protein
VYLDLRHTAHIELDGVVAADKAHGRPEGRTCLEWNVILVAEPDNSLNFFGASGEYDSRRDGSFMVIRSVMGRRLSRITAVAFQNGGIAGNIFFAYDSLESGVYLIRHFHS